MVECHATLVHVMGGMGVAAPLAMARALAAQTEVADMVHRGAEAAYGIERTAARSARLERELTPDISLRGLLPHGG